MGVALVCWPFLKDKTLVYGFLFGTSVSLICAYLLIKYTTKASAMDIWQGKFLLKQVAGIRITFMIASLYIAAKLPEIFNLMAAGAGLLVVPLIIHLNTTISAFISIIHSNKN